MTHAQFELGGVDGQDKQLKQRKITYCKFCASFLNSLSETKAYTKTGNLAPVLRRLS